jgi:ribosome assembly protein YihI (activator of Der GTPase)
MTQTPENPNERIDRLEATLTRFAELTFQSQARQDAALDRIESAIVNLAIQQQQTNQNVNAQSDNIRLLT